ncbi:CLUMA_CG012206, isoform A [Clunio marinus]|uniref:CLUMA_CG012206, isoform A n=1 Tax=Clunio marinus TaxID=568069 RepID=A0A1J1IJ29_9DIPT|nr:CLUMA_CG012206, isoform A [Clunio marinus]
MFKLQKQKIKIVKAISQSQFTFVERLQMQDIRFENYVQNLSESCGLSMQCVGCWLLVELIMMAV